MNKSQFVLVVDDSVSDEQFTIGCDTAEQLEQDLLSLATKLTDRGLDVVKGDELTDSIRGVYFNADMAAVDSDDKVVTSIKIFQIH